MSIEEKFFESIFLRKNSQPRTLSFLFAKKLTSSANQTKWWITQKWNTQNYKRHSWSFKSDIHLASTKLFASDHLNANDLVFIYFVELNFHMARFFKTSPKCKKLYIIRKVSSSSIQLYHSEANSTYLGRDETAFVSSMSCKDIISHMLQT